MPVGALNTPLDILATATLADYVRDPTRWGLRRDGGAFSRL